jgi:thiol:disulfide interchange protein
MTRSRGVTVAIFALVLALIAVLMAMQPKTGPSLVKWVPAAEAVRLSQQSGRPILYEFTAEWCPPCRRMDQQVFQNAAIAQRINDNFIAVRIMDRQREDGSNAPEVTRLQNLYGVSGFPTVVFVGANGHLKKRMVGYGGRASFELQLAALAP